MEINLDEGRQKLLARLGAGALARRNCWYNTGSAATMGDVMQYAQYLSIGSGSAPCALNQPSIASLRTFEATGSVVVVYELRRSLASAESAEVNEVISPANMVSLVRSVFALNVSDAAMVFGVTRPTIYQWSALSSFEMIRSAKVRDRIKSLYRLAKAWESFGQLHGRWQKAVLSDGVSILDLLRADEIDAKRIQKLHASLVAEQPRLKQEDHHNAVAAVSTLKSSFAKLAANEKARTKGAV